MIRFNCIVIAQSTSTETTKCSVASIMKNKGVGFRRISECYKYIDIIVMNGNNSSVAGIVFAKTSSFVSLRDCLVLRGETKRIFEGFDDRFAVLDCSVV